MGLSTLLFQFALGFVASLIFATTPRVAAAWPDRRAASTVIAHGMWVALVCGLALQVGVYLNAPDIVTCEATCWWAAWRLLAVDAATPVCAQQGRR